MKRSPFQGLDKPREVLAWGLYDLANQSFTLIIITLLFSTYVQQVVTPHPPQPDAVAAALELDTEARSAEQTAAIDTWAAEDERADGRGKFWWGLIHGSSLILVVIVSPLIGALADARGWRKRMLVVTGLLCSALTCMLAIPGPGGLLLAALIYIPGNLTYQVGENFLASFLPDVSTPRTMGKVSAIGWAMGYLGALLLLALLLTLAAVGLLNLSDQTKWPPTFILAGLWFFVFMIPSVLVLKEAKPDAPESASLFAESFGRLYTTIKQASRYAEVCKFLLAFLTFQFGANVIIAYAGILAEDFGILGLYKVVFVAQITITAGIAAVITSLFQDKIGAKRTLQLYLVIWLASAGGMILIKWIWRNASPDNPAPEWPFWLIGNGIGFGLGGLGTAGRAMIGRFTPKHRTAEFFGLWGMTMKLAAALGVMSFGIVAAWNELASLWLLLSFFVLGFLLLLPVREYTGVLVARRAERHHARARHALDDAPANIP